MIIVFKNIKILYFNVLKFKNKTNKRRKYNFKYFQLSNHSQKTKKQKNLNKEQL